MKDMDEAFIKQNPLTQGDFITEFFNLEKRQEEMWAAFFSKVENMMIEGWETFSNNFTEDDEFAVIQQNVRKDAQSSEYYPTLYQMIQAGKPLRQIKDSIIDIEKMVKKRQAHANYVRDFRRSKYDKHHHMIDSSQRAG